MNINFQGKEICINKLIKLKGNAHQVSVDVNLISKEIFNNNKDINIAIKKNDVYFLLIGDATTLPDKGDVTLNVITKHTLKLCLVNNEVTATKPSDNRNNRNYNSYGNTRPYRNGNYDGMNSSRNGRDTTKRM